MRQTNRITKWKFRKGSIAAALAAALAVTALAQPVFANTWDESNCSITVQYPNTETEEYSELPDTDVIVDVYQIAAAEGLPSADGYTFNWDDLYKDQKAKWEQMVADAKEKDPTNPYAAPTADEVEKLTQELTAVALEKVTTPYTTGNLGEAITLAKEDAGTTGAGLYLLIAHGDMTDYIVKDEETGKITTIANGETKQFIFSPILISVPVHGSDQISPSGDIRNTADSGDWQHELKIGAKVRAEDRLGKMRIEKVLPVNETMSNRLDPATFVFHIKAVKGKAEVTVYDDVATIVFNGEEMGDPIVIEDLPVGATVTVTEVYAGGDYKFSSAAAAYMNKTDAAIGYVTRGVVAKIVAEDTKEEMLIDTFTNVYDDTWNGSGSVTNKFALEGDNWKVTPDYSNAAEKQAE